MSHTQGNRHQSHWFIRVKKKGRWEGGETCHPKLSVKSAGQEYWVFLGLRKPLLVSFCVVVWVLFSVFWIFCFMSFGDHTIRNTKKLPEYSCYRQYTSQEQSSELLAPAHAPPNWQVTTGNVSLALFVVNPFTPKVNYGDMYRSSNFWVCERNPMVWPFKWNLFGSTFVWYHLFFNFFTKWNLVFFFWCWFWHSGS